MANKLGKSSEKGSAGSKTIANSVKQAATANGMKPGLPGKKNH